MFSKPRPCPLLLLLLMCTTPLSCSKKTTPPDLGGIYNRGAQHHDQFRNPVIVIPGVLGSKLVDSESGRMVWGAFGGDAISPKSPGGARTIALPLGGESSEFGQLHDGVKPAGVLDTLKLKMLGLSVKLGAYVNILRTLGAGGYRDRALGLSGAIDYGSDHYTCFQFSYDWRRDIAESAAQLDAFIKEKQAYVRDQNRKRYGVDQPVKFDIVAHSMGGLVTRYYLRYGTTRVSELGPNPTPNWHGAKHVEKVVLVGTPNAGSMETVITLSEGRGFVPLLPRYEAPLTGTFPSLYQMLPRKRHGAVVAAEDHQLKLDILDPELWHQMQWGLANPNEKELILQIAPPDLDWPQAQQLARAYQTKALHHARAFQRALDVPAAPPAGLVINLVAGDSVDTDAVVAVDRKARTTSIIAHHPGDGSVLRTSVLMDERLGATWQPKLISPIKFENLLLLSADHLGMTKDPTFTNNVLFYLLEAPPSN